MTTPRGLFGDDVAPGVDDGRAGVLRWDESCTVAFSDVPNYKLNRILL